MSIAREGSRDIEKGMLVSCAPDWCWVGTGANRVLVPFRITALQSDDANTAPTVLQQSKRSHTSGSIITKCSGDEPGTGLGVKSGTKESICWPITWSKTVKIEGKYAVRHFDLWAMNNGNTYGKLIYTDDTSDQKKPDNQLPTGEGYGPPRDMGNGVVSDAPADPVQGGQQYAQWGGLIGGSAAEFFARPPVAVPRNVPNLPPEITPRPAPAPRIPGESPWKGPIESVPRSPAPKLNPDVPPEAAPAPRPLPRPLPETAPKEDESHRTSRKCWIIEICFDRKDYDEREFADQLKMQEDKLNTKSPDQFLADRQRFEDVGSDGMREISGPFQRQARNDYIQANEDAYVKKYGEDKWNEHLDSLAALHRLDMVASGSPSDIARMGDKNINSSIGPQWTARKRIGALKKYAKEQQANGCPKMQVELLYDCDNPYRIRA